jgi:hypothetical protein
MQLFTRLQQAQSDNRYKRLNLTFAILSLLKDKTFISPIVISIKSTLRIVIKYFNRDLPSMILLALKKRDFIL